MAGPGGPLTPTGPVAPRVATTRRIYCTECNGPLDVSPRSRSVSCEHCNQRVVIEDLKISGYTAVSRLATCGRIEVTRKGRLVALVRAGELIVKGSVTGDVLAVTRIEVRKTGRLEGAIRSRRLEVRLGGLVNGPCAVGPDAVPEVGEE